MDLVSYLNYRLCEPSIPQMIGACLNLLALGQVDIARASLRTRMKLPTFSH